MLKLPTPASEYIFGNSPNPEPAQPDLSTDNNLGNTSKNQLEREEEEKKKREIKDIAKNYMGTSYEETNTPAENDESKD